MAEVLINDSTLLNIANSIRQKNHSENTYLPSQMGEAILNISIDGNFGEDMKYDVGEFVLDADVQNGVAIPHNLGELPDFLLIWTDDFANLETAPYTDYTTSCGLIYLRGLFGAPQRYTSVVDNTNPFYLGFSLSASSTRISLGVPTSTSYGIQPSSLKSDSFVLPKLANNYYWRAGITYKYFVTKAWWDTHEVE